MVYNTESTREGYTPIISACVIIQLYDIQLYEIVKLIVSLTITFKYKLLLLNGKYYW